MSAPPLTRTLSREENIKSLRDELSTLKLLCGLYDQSQYVIVPKMATSICILLRDENSRRPALVNRFGKLPHFLNAHRPIDERNMIAEHTGFGFRLGGGPPEYVASAVMGTPREETWIAQSRWWDQDIIKDDKKRYLKRKQILLWFRNTARGAHAATYIEQVFDDLVRNESLGWTAEVNGQQVPFANAPSDAQVRQLAYEAIETAEAVLAEL